MTNTLRKAVFVDRDGTLNRMVYDDTHGLMDSPRRPRQVEVVPGAGRFLKRLRDMGYLIIVVTNQPGIAKRTMTLRELGAVNRRLAALLDEEGGKWDALYYCPHHPGDGSRSSARHVRACDCRKPKPGLLLRAADKHGIDLEASWMIGDGLNDIQAGRLAGCLTVLLTRLKIEQLERFVGVAESTPDIIAPDFVRALALMRSMPTGGTRVTSGKQKARR